MKMDIVDRLRKTADWMDFGHYDFLTLTREQLEELINVLDAAQNTEAVLDTYKRIVNDMRNNALMVRELADKIRGCS